MISNESSSTMGESRQPAQSSLKENRGFKYGLMRYGLAVVFIAVGLLIRFALEALVGTGLPTYITFYPFLMLAALLGGFGPGLVATILTMLVVHLYIFPPFGQFTLSVPSRVDLAGLILFGFMGLFISLVAELFRRNNKKAAAYDREQALLESRKEKEFLADLLQNAGQPFAVSYPDGGIMLFNRAFEILTGYPAQELATIDWVNRLTPPEWRDPERRKLDELKATGKPVRYEKEYIRKDGRRVPIELLTQIGHEAEGGREYYYAFITDLTTRKEAEIREANERLQQHSSEVQAVNDALRESRMAALNMAEDADVARRQSQESNRNLLSEIAERKKTEEILRTTAEELASANRDLESFSYSVSHDLRNPLNIISGFAGILLEDYAGRLDEEGREYLRRVNDGVRKMKEIIEDMLSLSRIGRQEMNRRDVDLSAMVHDYLNEMKSTNHSRQAEFVVQENVYGDADPRMIHLALENLLRNSWKFTSKREVARIEFGATVKDDRTVYFIRDNGVGFDMQFADKIFEPFKRGHVEKEFGGTGVGLSIVQRVIKRHGGKVWAESEVGKGATFYFTLGAGGVAPG